MKKSESTDTCIRHAHGRDRAGRGGDWFVAFSYPAFDILIAEPQVVTSEWVRGYGDGHQVLNLDELVGCAATFEGREATTHILCTGFRMGFITCTMPQLLQVALSEFRVFGGDLRGSVRNRGILAVRFTKGRAQYLIDVGKMGGAALRDGVSLQDSAQERSAPGGEETGR